MATQRTDAAALAERLYVESVDLEHPGSWTQTALCCIDAARAFAAECDDHRDRGRPARAGYNPPPVNKAERPTPPSARRSRGALL